MSENSIGHSCCTVAGLPAPSKICVPGSLTSISGAEVIWSSSGNLKVSTTVLATEVASSATVLVTSANVGAAEEEAPLGN